MNKKNVFKTVSLFTVLMGSIQSEAQNNTAWSTSATNIGIGTGSTTPNFAPLQIQTVLTPNNTADALRTISVEKRITSTLTRRSFLVPHLFGGAYNPITQGNDFGLFWADAGNADQQTNSTAGFVIAPWSGTTSGIRIQANGSVGINTGTPEGPFQVGSGLTRVSLGNTYPTAANHWQTSYIGFNLAYIGSGGNWTSKNGGSQNGSGAIWANTEGELSFIVMPTTNGGADRITSDADVYGKVRMKIQSDGKILIGDIGNGSPITSPGNYKLYVQDGILTEKIKVALKTTGSWSDYVFDSSYKLKTLEEVEAYVKENKHLEGIPSAGNLVKDGGIDLGNMQAIQMAKIEELTLYVIELKKEINALKKQQTNLSNIH